MSENKKDNDRNDLLYLTRDAAPVPAQPAGMANKAQDVKGDASHARASQDFHKPAVAGMERRRCLNFFHGPGSLWLFKATRVP